MAAKVRACRTEVTQLLSWAEPFPHRTWAIEGADGLGYLLAQESWGFGGSVDIDVNEWARKAEGSREGLSAGSEQRH